MAILPHEALISPGARERWLKWKMDIKQAERRIRPVQIVNTTSEIRSCGPHMFEEERLREQMRREHMRALLDETWNIVQNGSPSSEWDAATLSSPSDSRSHTPNHLGQSLHLADEANNHRPNGNFVEASHSAFVNSTQQLPTMLTYGTSADACPDYMLSESSTEIDQKGMSLVEYILDFVLTCCQEFSDPLYLSGDPSASSAEHLLQFEPKSFSNIVPCSPLKTHEPSTCEIQNVHRAPSASPVNPSRCAKTSHPLGVHKGKLFKEDHITDTVGAIAIIPAINTI